jgi:predicted enzyme related to lactoylglutathione lyase
MFFSAARIFVGDLDRARRFYAGRLGLPIKADGPQHGYCVFALGDVDLVVEEVGADAPPDERAMVGRFTGLSFGVDDLAATHARLSAAGIHFTGPPERQVWGGWLATFADDEGNQLQLVQPPP